MKNICVICNQELGTMRINLINGIATHIYCFYENIPSPTPKTNPDHVEKEQLREELIQKRINEIIEKYSKQD